jgi:hypothetical protein
MGPQHVTQFMTIAAWVYNLALVLVVKHRVGDMGGYESVIGGAFWLSFVAMVSTDL